MAKQASNNLLVSGSSTGNLWEPFDRITITSTADTEVTISRFDMVLNKEQLYIVCFGGLCRTERSSQAGSQKPLWELSLEHMFNSQL